MEVEVVCVIQEVPGQWPYIWFPKMSVYVPFLGRMFELLVIVVDDLRYGSVA